MKKKATNTGTHILDKISWGTHICQFYQSKQDLLDILIPYFQAGLENNEFCIWITSEPLDQKEAEEAMKKAIPGFDQYLERGQIEIIPHTDWYLKDGVFDLKRVLNAWIDKHIQALAKGYDGLRVTGNTAWIEKKDWRNFADYEEEVHKAIGEYRIKAICSYCLDRCGALEALEVIGNHQCTYVRQEGKWKLIHSAEGKQWLETLRESEEKYRTMIETSNDLIWMLDKAANFTYFNHKAEEVSGYKLKEWLGKSFAPLLPSQELERMQKIFLEVMNGKPRQYEVSVYKKDGSTFILSVNSTPLYSDGKVVGTISFGQDITESKRAKKELEIALEQEAKSAKEWQEIFDATTDIIVLISPDHKILKINKRGCEALGKKSEELIGKVCYQVVHELDHPIDGCPSIETMNTMAAASAEITAYGRHCLVSASPILDQKDRLVGFVHTIKDITKYKQTQEELQETQNYLENLINYANAPIIVWDGKLRITRFNNAFEHLTGYTAKEVLGQKLHILFPKETREKSLREIELALKGKHWDSVEIPILCKDETIRVALWNSANIQRETDRAPMATIAQGVDITDRKKAQEELTGKNTELEGAYQELKRTQTQLIQAAKMAAMGELGAGIAHELNQPLGGIKGFTQIALSELDQGSPLKADLKTIEEQADRMVKIVRNISAFSRQTTYELSPIDINVPLEKALMLFTQQLKDSNINLVMEVGQSLPRVSADSNQLQQVFLNVIGNARDALNETEKTDKELAIVVKPAAEFVEITFTDNGCGIPKDNLKKIFDPFFTTKPVGRGTGLGLSINYGIIKDHSGLIDVASEKGKGTAVKIILPTVKSKTCWETKKCPEDIRRNCIAFKENKGHLCWTVKGSCCRKLAAELGKSFKDICKECEIYKRKTLAPSPKPAKVNIEA